MKSTSMRLWVGLFVLVVFAIGAAVGMVLGPLLTLRSRPAFDQPGPRRGSPPPPFAERLLDRIATEIDLSLRQEQQLREIFESRRRRFREINEEVRDRFEIEREQMNADIGSILTPVQFGVFEDEIVRMRRRGPRGPNQFQRRRGPSR